MTSDIDICNLALLRLGTRSSIASFSEGSVEANACARVYALLRDMLLASHQWSFATHRVILADLGHPLDGWAFRYAYPSDCLRARMIRPPRMELSETSRNVPPFEVSGDVNDQGQAIKVILCNIPRAELIYTARLYSPDLFPPHFIEALSWIIAAELANALSGDDGLAQSTLQMATQAISACKCVDANESPVAQDHMPDWITVRGFAHADPDFRR